MKMKSLIYCIGLGMMIVLLSLTSCLDDEISEENLYTVEGETIGEYIENRSDLFSEFCELLDTTDVLGLLEAYGKYTCFLPTNEAMNKFYKDKGAESLNDFSIDELTKIAYHHIIKDTLKTTQFVEGFQSRLTMSGRNLDIAFVPDTIEGGLTYIVNDSCKIVDADNSEHNGIVHVIDGVITPAQNTLDEIIAKDNKFSLFYEALVATGLDTMLRPIKDDDYENNIPEMLAGYENNELDHTGIYTRIPKKRKYGFTALMESDDTYHDNGIYSLDDMEAYADNIYGDRGDFKGQSDDRTSSSNNLYRFVAYHLLKKKVTKDLFVERYYHTGAKYETEGTTHAVQTYDMYEYYETMCPNTLLEARTYRSNSSNPKPDEFDVFNMLESGEAVRLTDDVDNEALNGVYHEVDGMLVYSLQFVGELSTKRLRMDASSFFPELTNNDMRRGCVASGDDQAYWYLIPDGYLERVESSETTVFGYITPHDGFCDYQGDEVFLGKTRAGGTMYDFTVTTKPIPAGTYEVRFGYQPTGARGVAQLYWDGQPCGIPLDLRINADDPEIGYIEPGTDASDVEGFENDKMMRNRGYMKGPACYKAVNEATFNYNGATSRQCIKVVRRILGTFTFDEASTHTFGVRAAKKGEFMFDYLEFVPTECIEEEGIE